MVEQLTVNQLVAGSNPARGAIIKPSLLAVFFLKLIIFTRIYFVIDYFFFYEKKFNNKNRVRRK